MDMVASRQQTWGEGLYPLLEATPNGQLFIRKLTIFGQHISHCPGAWSRAQRRVAAPNRTAPPAASGRLSTRTRGRQYVGDEEQPVVTAVGERGLVRRESWAQQ